METGNKIWDVILAEQKRYNDLQLNSIKDYDKFYIYSIIAHSTAIEGSTLTEKDAQLLFDEGIVAKGKSITEHLMNLDLKAAYEYAASEAARKTVITPELLQYLNSLVLKNTGGVHNMAAGTFDSAKGEYRLCGVRAGMDGKSYMNYTKITDSVILFCDEISKRLNVNRLQDIYNLSFDAHLNLVSIHPWVDGNGRTSRLLMNYIQFYHGVTPTKIYKEDKSEYIDALEKSREMESPEPFRVFMAKQYLKTLQNEIDTHIKDLNQTNDFRLLF